MPADRPFRFRLSILPALLASITLLSGCGDETPSTGADGTDTQSEISVSAAHSLMPTGFKQRVTVTRKDGTLVDPNEVTWKTLDGLDITEGGSDEDPFSWSAAEGVLLADADSAFTGQFTLIATVGSDSAEFDVEVVRGTLASSLTVISPAESVMPVGYTVQYEALAIFELDGGALQLDVTDVASWESTNPESLGTVPEANGLMKALEPAEGIYTKASYSNTFATALNSEASGDSTPIDTVAVESMSVEIVPENASDAYIVGYSVPMVAMLTFNGTESWDVTYDATWTSSKL